jgi:hypothetical protein
MYMKKRNECGSLILAALVVTLLLFGLAGAYITTTVANTNETRVFSDAIQADYAAEAGIDAVIMLLGNQSSVPSTFTGTYGTAGAAYSVTYVNLGADGVDNNKNGAIDEADEGNFRKVVSTGSYEGFSRTIETTLSRYILSYSPFGFGAAFGKDGLNTNGDTLFVDSYDSDCGTYASQKTHTMFGKSYANPKGHMGTNDDITLGGGYYYGNMTPGPGGTLTGSTTQVAGNTSSASSPRDMPSMTYSTTLVSGGAISAAKTINAGTYRYDSIILSGAGKTVTINGDVTLYIDGQIKTTGNGNINITAGSKLTIYQGPTGTIDLGGNAIINANNRATACMIYSASTLTVKVAGTSDFYGAIYAPDAVATQVGTSVVYGSVVGKTFNITGTCEMHYDEALSRLLPITTPTYTYNIIAWRYQ